MRRCAWWGVALGACAACSTARAPVDVPAAPVRAPPSAPPGCAEAAALMVEAHAAEERHDPRCAVRAAVKARGLCAGLANPAVARLAAVADTAREQHGTVRALGPWLLEWVTTAGETRVWEVGPDGARLRFRIDAEDVALSSGSKLRVALGPDVAVVDPATGTAARAAGAVFVAEGAGYLFVGDEAQVRRLRLADLAPTGVARWTWEDPSPSEGATVLRGGGLLVFGTWLVSIDAGAVLRSDLRFGGARPDGARILAFDDASQSMLEIDTTTGAELARFAIPAQGKVDSSNLVPGYAPDPRYAFWFEMGPERRQGGVAVVVAAGDTRTGRVHRFEDRTDTWSIAFSSTAHVDPDSGRLCAELYSFHGGWTLCDWRMAAGGRVRRDPQPVRGPRPALASLGLAGATEVTRAWTPDHRRLLVLTFVLGEQDIKRDLRLTIVDAAGKVERVAVLAAGELWLDDSGLREAWRAAEYPELPRVVPVDDAHALVLHGRGDVGDKLVDLRTGAVSDPCGGREGCVVAARFAIDPGGGARDVVTGRGFALSASAAEWAAAPHAEAPCP